ncbi:MAG: FkbM family methyltransferase [Alphaproteobacteria bacterium]|nr:FkbM family methyltransferase [Alphaproteobacteria bacterium]
MMDSRLSLHHIGGRNGVRAFPICARFERDFVSVFHDADPDCLPQIRDNNRGLESTLHVLPYCLWSRPGRVDFHIARDPYASSILPFDPAAAGRFVHFAWDHDYAFAETMPAAETRAVEALTLDQALARSAEVPPPDFLSIDTQGAELAILEGAPGTLAGVLALQLEVSFLRQYRDQPLFGEVAAWLAARGFDFLRFTATSEALRHRVPIGQRGENTLVSADALFARRVETLPTPPARAKFAFVMIVQGHTDLAAAALDGLAAADLAALTPRYVRFLEAYDAARKSHPGLMPWTFGDKWPEDSGRRRFAAGAEAQAEIGHALVARRRAYLDRLRSQMDTVKALLAEAPYGVETVLRDNGFADQAETLMRHRRAQTASLIKELQEGRVF